MKTPASVVEVRTDWHDPELLARFESKVAGGVGGCREWNACLNDRGYGIFVVGQTNIRAHRAAHLIYVGPIGDKCVCHRCDNRRCVNPEHLFLGTKNDNTQDAIAKGRLACGARHGMAKMTDHEVIRLLKLRKNGAGVPELVRIFGLTRSYIYQIIRRENWRHLDRSSK